MPPGLTYAFANFQRRMKLVLALMNWKDCFVYIDDVLIWSETFSEHFRKLELVFKAFERAGLQIKDRKCHVCCFLIAYLGHILSSNVNRKDANRVKAVSEMAISLSKKDV